MTRDEDKAGDAANAAHTVTIKVNNKGVELPKGEYTGADIKAAAIAQGVDIQLGFILSLMKGQSEEKPRIIGDGDTVKIHEHMAFRAVDSDDNS